MQINKEKVTTSKGVVEYSVCGSGEPNIILINGGSGPIEGWMKVLEDVSKMSSVFCYNRLGVGGSDKPQENQDGIAIIETLRETLSLIGIKPPYVIVGHSLGGLYANLFARLYPDEVAALVFLEASHPEDMKLDEYQGKIIKTINKLLSIFDSLSKHKKLGEVHFVKETISQLNLRETFPDIPLYVVTGTKENRLMPKEALTIRRKNQLDLLSLSKDSKQMLANNSGHFPQLTEPNLVIGIINEAVQKSRKNC
ncbi:alpha/beta hydrolase [Niallia circulans]|uniref:Alpha/beta hydrolase n=1 Tax=Niallia circulans TaxID=1397 RepID=A0A553SSK1_NIACI|nr:alpha/beta hydrolase [Niallia circulans]TRZ39975.1 alpha/beta hydrolase [Niallia circulans]